VQSARDVSRGPISFAGKMIYVRHITTITVLLDQHDFSIMSGNYSTLVRSWVKAAGVGLPKDSSGV
jgi:hypothetical protein